MKNNKMQLNHFIKQNMISKIILLEDLNESYLVNDTNFYLNPYPNFQMWKPPGKVKRVLLDVWKMHLSSMCLMGRHSFWSYIQTFRRSIWASYYSNKRRSCAIKKTTSWTCFFSSRSSKLTLIIRLDFFSFILILYLTF